MKYLDLPHGNTALAIFPCSPGFGWMLFDGPLSPVRWGRSNVAKKKAASEVKNGRCLRAIEKLLHEHRPAVVVLEAFEGPGTKRGARIQALCRSIISLAAVNGASVRVISRAQVSACLRSAESDTRYGFAKRAASFLAEIRVRLPTERKFWKTEDPVMALFNAAVLLIVHYANPSEPL